MKNNNENQIRLNKYIAQAGICSRREADKLIEKGLIKVNDKIIKKLGYKVNVKNDIVKIKDRVIYPEKKIYILLNKTKDCLCTVKDPQGRKTVIELIKNSRKFPKEYKNYRIFPVGRLDRNSTGLILITNDGNIAKKLTHPSHNIKKIYYVLLNKPLPKNDLNKLIEGIKLDDGFAYVDMAAYINKAKNELAIEIHSGKNRIIRRIFENLGYKVKKLDRVYFAGLTKKNLPRGRWRFLTEKEIAFLKMINTHKG